jgi:uncharacterized protein (TIGR03437 family)
MPSGNEMMLMRIAQYVSLILIASLTSLASLAQVPVYRTTAAVGNRTPALGDDRPGVFNAASFADPAMPNGAIARGSLFTVFDTTRGDYPEQAYQYPLPTTLGGEQYSTQVSVGNTTVDAIMFYAGYSRAAHLQINAVLPSSIPTGNGVLRIFGSGRLLSTHSIRVVDRSFGVFTRDQNGIGIGIVQNEGSDKRLSDNSLLNTARSGQVAVLWGTGLGPVTGNEAAGPLPGNLLSSDVHVWVGGKDAALLYGGRSGCCAGLDQINFVVPSGVEGCYVPVAVQTGNIVSNYVTMSITSSGGTCSLPWGTTSTEIEAARAKGSIRLGNIFLSYGAVADSIRNASFYDVDLWGVGSALFSNYPVDDYGTSDNFTVSEQPTVSYTLPPLQGMNGTMAPGTCVVGSLHRPEVAPIPPLDAGNDIALTSGSEEVLLGVPGRYYNNNLHSFPYSVVPPSSPYVGSGPPSRVTNRPGVASGSDVGAFDITPRIPAGLVWTNIDAIAVVNRAEGVRVTWVGGDSDGFVYINGLAGTASFSCLERATAGSFTVPPSVTLALPPEGEFPFPYSGYDTLLYLVNMAKPVRFNAAALDAGFLAVPIALLRNVRYR